MPAKQAPVFNYATKGSKSYGGAVPAAKVEKLCAAGRCNVVKPEGGVRPVSRPPLLGNGGVHGGVYANGDITYH